KVVLALIAMITVSRIDYRRIAEWSKALLIVALGLLVATKVIGVSSGGASRWLNIGGLVFQPSDLARVALIVYLAMLLSRKQDYIKSFRRAFLPIMMWIVATIALIGSEDLSTAVLVLATALVMCVVGRVSFLHLGGLGVLAILMASLLVMSSPGRA